jgi:hypothetical protein
MKQLKKLGGNMQKIEYKKEMEVQEQLKVSYTSENISIKMIGWEEKKFELIWNLEAKEMEQNQLQETLRVNYDVIENSLEIDTTDVEDEFQISKSELTLYIPITSQITAKAENGSLKLEHLQGEQKVETENGSIILTDILGNVRCESENGSMKLVKITGEIKLEIENGSIKLEECTGTIEIEGENGQIRVSKSDFSSAVIRNENGGIYYELLPIEKGDFRFENENGKIHLIVPEEIPYTIIAKNRYGKFHVGLNNNYDKKKDDDEFVIEMTNGSGNVKIFAENENGSIRLMSEPTAPFIQTVKFDTEQFNKYFDKFSDMLPDEEHLEMVKEKIEKMKEKIGNLNIQIPDMEKIFQNSFHIIEKEIKYYSDPEKFKSKGKEIAESIKLNLDEIMKKAEEKMTDINAKEKIQQEINQISAQLEKLGHFVTDEENLKVLKEKLAKLKEKIAAYDIHLPDFEKLFEDSMKLVEKELEKHIDMEKWKSKGKEIAKSIKLNLDEIMKKAEEKISDTNAKEKLQQEISQISAQLEKLGHFVTDEENLKVLKEKLVQLKEKIAAHDIHLPDFEKLFDDSMQLVEKELEKHIDMEKWKSKGKEIGKLVKENVTKALDKIEIQLSNMELNAKDRETVDARSRMKILEMLEKKIITADEAEKLIKAMENRNARD